MTNDTKCAGCGTTLTHQEMYDGCYYQTKDGKIYCHPDCAKLSKKGDSSGK